LLPRLQLLLLLLVKPHKPLRLPLELSTRF
jgi:hypothetical protein